jgi:hypothetical protein
MIVLPLPPYYHHCHIQTSALKAALFYIESALPVGAVPEHKRWSNEQFWLWCWSIREARDPVRLMECVCALESAIDPLWLLPAAPLLLQSLPNHTTALHQASWAAIAYRLWLVDSLLQYDKVLRSRRCAFFLRSRLHTQIELYGDLMYLGSPRLSRCQVSSSEIQVQAIRRVQAGKGRPAAGYLASAGVLLAPSTSPGTGLVAPPALSAKAKKAKQKNRRTSTESRLSTDSPGLAMFSVSPALSN